MKKKIISAILVGIILTAALVGGIQEFKTSDHIVTRIAEDIPNVWDKKI